MLLERLLVSQQLNLLLSFSLNCSTKTVCLADWAGNSLTAEMLNYFLGLWMVSVINVQCQALGGSLVFWVDFFILAFYSVSLRRHQEM